MAVIICQTTKMSLNSSTCHQGSDSAWARACIKGYQATVDYCKVATVRVQQCSLARLGMQASEQRTRVNPFSYNKKGCDGCLDTVNGTEHLLDEI
jgi:hypothetical protein